MFVGGGDRLNHGKNGILRGGDGDVELLFEGNGKKMD